MTIEIGKFRALPESVRIDHESRIVTDPADRSFVRGLVDVARFSSAANRLTGINMVPVAIVTGGALFVANTVKQLAKPTLVIAGITGLAIACIPFQVAKISFETAKLSFRWADEKVRDTFGFAKPNEPPTALSPEIASFQPVESSKFGLSKA